MATGPELMRQHYLEMQGEEDPHVAAALELRKRWLSVNTELAPGGTLYLEKQGVTTVAVLTVMILWRPLDWENDFDWKIIETCLQDPHTPLPGEQWDWLVGYLDGDQLIIVPHALCLLQPYDLVVEIP